MLATGNDNTTEDIDPATLFKEKYRNGIHADGYEMQTITQKVTRLGTFFGHTSYSECTLAMGKKTLSKSLHDLTRNENHTSRIYESLARETYSGNLNENALLRFSATEHRIVKEAGRRVTNLLMLHAWRCRRSDAQQSRTLANALNNKVESLNMQVYVLRQLLDNEKTKRNLALRDLDKIILENEKEMKIILQEKETLEIKITELLDTVMKLKDESENQKSNLKAAKTEAETWESLCKKEKKKLKTLKDQNLILEQEVKEMDEKLVCQTQCLEELNQSQIKLEEKLDAQTPLLNAAMEQIRTVQQKLKLSEELGVQKERFLMEKDEEINQLRAQIALMEEKLREQDERNGELGKLISDKTKELILLHDKLGELTKNQRFWGNRVIKMASLCTRIPIACFYTVATLLLPQPSYSSL